MHYTANLLNRAFDSGSIIKKLKKDVAEAWQEVEITNAASKCSDEALSKVKAELAQMKPDWAREKENVEQELANAKKEVAKVVENFKAFEDFMVAKARALANF